MHACMHACVHAHVCGNIYTLPFLFVLIINSYIHSKSTTYQISRLCRVFPILLVLLTFTLLKGRSREVQTKSTAAEIATQPVSHFITTIKGGHCICLHSASIIKSTLIFEETYAAYSNF